MKTIMSSVDWTRIKDNNQYLKSKEVPTIKNKNYETNKSLQMQLLWEDL